MEVRGGGRVAKERETERETDRKAGFRLSAEWKPLRGVV